MRTFLLAVVTTGAAVLAVALPAAPVSAAPPSTTVVDCGSANSGFRSWISIHATNLACGHAKDLAKSWSSGCSWPKANQTTTCTREEDYATHKAVFTCTATKATASPAHYNVSCVAAHHLHKVTFTYFNHGF